MGIMRSMNTSSQSRLESTKKKKYVLRVVVCSVLLLLGIVIGGVFGWMAREAYRNDPLFFSPFIEEQIKNSSKPLQKYSILELAQKDIKPSEIRLLSIIEDTADFTSYEFSYKATGGTITGQINIPQNIRENISTQGQVVAGDGTVADASSVSAIIMLRGYYPLESYTTGGGTRNGAAVFARAGFITIAPDFLGYGNSDAEFVDSWEARFARPLQVIELITTIEKVGLPVPNTQSSRVEQTAQSKHAVAVPTKIGLWGHSNGGYIALSVLQILGRDIPTTLWAPVTAPFPYSVLYYGLEQSDEGKSQRKWLALLEEKYDVFDFSISKHINRLTGTIQLHHGITDSIAPITWSDAFRDSIDAENIRRSQVRTQAQDESSASISGTLAENELVKTAGSAETPLPDTNLQYFRYPTTDHNMQPSWNTVVQRDIEFFRREFGE